MEAQTAGPSPALNFSGTVGKSLRSGLSDNVEYGVPVK